MILKMSTGVLLAITVFIQSFSLLSIKISTLESGAMSFFLLFMALVFIGIRTILWQYLIKFNELSQIYPYTSFVQVLIFLYSIILFGETVTIYNILGLLSMLVGVYFISR